MKNSNLIKDKSYDFALHIIKIVQKIRNQHNEYALTGQLIRSGTSIGANIEEAVGAQSRNDFLHKISVAYKEARESNYWIRLLRDSKYLDAQVAEKLLKENLELLKIIGSIQKTIKKSGSLGN
jgi:four helix bundle protein